eukprot:TRINITY_DN8515_c0_g2_i1.p1 TRINITY_DN8515_c0_g2~~TRINITY_DN8515_c0_g2_i1.p1  ORF type:complete len:137 (+),score=35.67 TRINITY_DN8515_c0_g2_i1:329-739(+)
MDEDDLPAEWRPKKRKRTEMSASKCSHNNKTATRICRTAKLLKAEQKEYCVKSTAAQQQLSKLQVPVEEAEPSEISNFEDDDDDEPPNWQGNSESLLLALCASTAIRDPEADEDLFTSCPKPPIRTKKKTPRKMIH